MASLKVCELTFNAFSTDDLRVLKDATAVVLATSLADAISHLSNRWTNREITTTPGNPLVAPPRFEDESGEILEVGRDHPFGRMYHDSWHSVIDHVDITAVKQIETLESATPEAIEKMKSTESYEDLSDVIVVNYEIAFLMEGKWRNVVGVLSEACLSSDDLAKALNARCNEPKCDFDDVEMRNYKEFCKLDGVTASALESLETNDEFED